MAFFSISGYLHAQSFELFKKPFQIHGFFSQGYVYTDGNNWLTMNTNKNGSAHMTDMGLNLSTKLTDKLRVGAQVYSRNLGKLGEFEPVVDWAVLDFKFKPWLGFRGGRVKTTFGLYNDTQDMDCLHVFSIMPQGIYPLDVRDTMIAHWGGDVYGKIPLSNKLGSFDYTVFAGQRRDSMKSGYPYFLSARGTTEKWFEALQYGTDLRWNTPVKGLIVGGSWLSQDPNGFGILNGQPNNEHNIKTFTTQAYGTYSYKNLRVDTEFRRFYRHVLIRNLTAHEHENIHSMYIAGSYRINKWLELGSYYSRYSMTSSFMNLLDTSLPSGHDYDKVVSAKVDLNRFVYVKAEGHFMAGYAYGPYPNGYYPQQNPIFTPNTRALVVKTGFNF
jgi:hypothetical protein